MFFLPCVNFNFTKLLFASQTRRMTMNSALEFYVQKCFFFFVIPRVNLTGMVFKKRYVACLWNRVEPIKRASRGVGSVCMPVEQTTTEQTEADGKRGDQSKQGQTEASEDKEKNTGRNPRFLLLRLFRWK